MTRDAKELLDLRVIATDSGREIGIVDQLLFKPDQHALFGLVVKPSDGAPLLLLRRDDVQSFGQDAVTVSQENVVGKLSADTEARRLVEGPGHRLNIDIFTTDGNKVGSVDKVLLNGDGSVNAYRTASGILGMGAKQEIMPSEIVAASEDSIIVDKR